MPTWLKIVLILLVLGVLVLVATGVVISKFVKHESREADRARAQGKGHGFMSDLPGCVEEGVRRMNDCDDHPLLCGLRTDAFLWGCMDEAGFDADYCTTVAPVDRDQAVRRWAESACSRYGRPGDETCAFSLSAVSSFCSFNATAG